MTRPRPFVNACKEVMTGFGGSLSIHLISGDLVTSARGSRPNPRSAVSTEEGRLKPLDGRIAPRDEQLDVPPPPVRQGGLSGHHRRVHRGDARPDRVRRAGRHVPVLHRRRQRQLEGHPPLVPAPGRPTGRAAGQRLCGARPTSMWRPANVYVAPGQRLCGARPTSMWRPANSLATWASSSAIHTRVDQGQLFHRGSVGHRQCPQHRQRWGHGTTFTLRGHGSSSIRGTYMFRLRLTE